MFDSLPILLLLILSGGLGNNGCNDGCGDNKNTLAMCLCLLLLSGCNDTCGDF